MPCAKAMRRGQPSAKRISASLLTCPRNAEADGERERERGKGVVLCYLIFPTFASAPILIGAMLFGNRRCCDFLQEFYEFLARGCSPSGLEALPPALIFSKRPRWRRAPAVPEAQCTGTRGVGWGGVGAAAGCKLAQAAAAAMDDAYPHRWVARGRIQAKILGIS